MRQSWWKLVVIFLVQTAVLPFWWPGMHAPDLWLATITLWVLFKDWRAGILPLIVGAISSDIVVGNFFSLHFVGYTLAILVARIGAQYLQVSSQVAVLLTVLGGMVAVGGEYVVFHAVTTTPLGFTLFEQLVTYLPNVVLTGAMALPALFFGTSRH